MPPTHPVTWIIAAERLSARNVDDVDSNEDEAADETPDEEEDAEVPLPLTS